MERELVGQVDSSRPRLVYMPGISAAPCLKRGKGPLSCPGSSMAPHNLQKGHEADRTRIPMSTAFTDESEMSNFKQALKADGGAGVHEV